MKRMTRSEPVFRKKILYIGDLCGIISARLYDPRISREENARANQAPLIKRIPTRPGKAAAPLLNRMKASFGKKLLILAAVSVVFAILGYLLIFACGSSLLSPVISAWKLFRSSSATETEISEGSEESVDFYEREKSRMQELSKEESSKDPDVISLIESDEPSVSEDEDTVKSSEVVFPYYGDKFAELSVDGTSIQGASLYFGDGKAQLKKGVGMYAGSSYPGMGSTCLISGHNNRDFHALKDAEVGAMIRVSTLYGEYVYRITSCEIRQATDDSAYDLSATVENIILYTCYPFNELGLTSKRYFVYGEYVSGPRILLDE